MVKDAQGVVKLNPNSEYRDALNHLDEFSHIWIIFEFHRHENWRPTTRPPRIDGPKRVGIFASRSPHRPNPIGLSAVKLEKIDLDARGGIEIHVSGVDIMDGSPVLDIKPYIPFADRIVEANGGWADSEITRHAVSFSQKSSDLLDRLSPDDYPKLKLLITQMLEWDPRPTTQRRAKPIQDPAMEGQEFFFRVSDFDVRWQILNQAIHVLELIPLPTNQE
jgi:tRNA-Thr(GGU) m(6)t(6)A37 methyltransferase TsaA